MAGRGALHALGVSWEDAYKGASRIRPVKHRLEYLRSIGGKPVYDDTAATSPAATLAAIQALKDSYEQVTVIVGGEGKGNDYTHLRSVLEQPEIRAIGIGGDVCQTLGISPSPSLQSALESALSNPEAREAVLISPAGAGFHSVHNEGGGGLRQLIRRWGRTRKRR